MIYIVSSIIPLILLGHSIENLYYFLPFLLFVFIRNLYISFSSLELIIALFLLPFLVFIYFSNSIAFTLPYIFLILLFPLILFIFVPSCNISSNSLLFLNLFLLLYILYFLFFNFTDSFGNRSIQFFNDNDKFGKFAFNFGFSSPARAALILFTLYYINYFSKLKFSTKIVFNTILFVLIILTLNRTALIFALFPILHYLRIKYLYFIILFIFILFFIFSNLNIFPFLERFERVMQIFYFDTSYKSFDYKNFIENITFSQAIVRSSDFTATVAILNLGYLGLFFYFTFSIIFCVISKKYFKNILVLFFLFISFKNYSFLIDISLFYFFLNIKINYV